MLKKSEPKTCLVYLSYFIFVSNFKTNETMKKLVTLLVVGAVAFMYACGPSAKELEEKRIADSIRVADSLAMVQAEQQRIADSIAKAQEEKKKADSIAHEDSIKKGLIKKAKAPKKK
jgi:hypothetical protein